MKVRLLSALAALILAIAGAALIAAYVQGADQRALAGTKTQAVLVVIKPIAAGTPVSGLAPFLQVKQIPVAALADGAMGALPAGVTDEVTAVALVPGEQLLRSRLVQPSDAQASGSVPVPSGLQTVTIQLGPQQTVGASIKAGDTVGVFISASGTTKLEIQQLLVTRVQGAPADPTSGSSGDGASTGAGGASDPAPTGSMLVTFAASGADAEKLVFATQFATIWLSNQPADAVQTTPGATQVSVVK